MNFKIFLIESEKSDIKQTLDKIPKIHSKLIKDYKINLEDGNTLKKSSEHVGEIDEKNKKITIVGGWHYSKEFILLHEIGHQIYDKLCSKKWKDEWEKIVKKHDKRQKQNSEELWCMNYANYFCKHKNLTHFHPSWTNYMKRFCDATDTDIDKSL